MQLRPLLRPVGNIIKQWNPTVPFSWIIFNMDADKTQELYIHLVARCYYSLWVVSLFTSLVINCCSQSQLLRILAKYHVLNVKWERIYNLANLPSPVRAGTHLTCTEIIFWCIQSNWIYLAFRVTTTFVP